jgi:hypothetical protein
MLLGVVCKGWEGAACDEVGTGGSANAKIFTKVDKGSVAYGFTMATEAASTKVNGFITSMYGILGTDSSTLPDNVTAAILINYGHSPVSVIQRNGHFWVF